MSTLFGKYEIKKVHGETDPNAQYFVLRIDTDPAARAALLVYADQIKDDDPEFAKELQAWVFVYTGSNLTKREPDDGDSLAETELSNDELDTDYQLWSNM
jgi:hypothetical protein